MSALTDTKATSELEVRATKESSRLQCLAIAGRCLAWKSLMQKGDL